MNLQWILEILLNKQDHFQKTLRMGIHISSLKKFKKEFCKSKQSSANFTTVFKEIVLKSKMEPKALYNKQKWIQLNAKLLYMSVKTNAINYLHIKIQNRIFFFLNSLTNKHIWVRIIFYHVFVENMCVVPNRKKKNKDF